MKWILLVLLFTDRVIRSFKMVLTSVYSVHKEELHGLRQASLKVLINDNLRIRLGGGTMGSRTRAQSLSRVWLLATPWIAARQASLSITISRSSLKLTSIESIMPSSHLILCHTLFLLPLIPPSIRVFSNESTLRMRWPKYWSFSFSIIPSKNIQDWSLLVDWLDLIVVQGTLKSLL